MTDYLLTPEILERKELKGFFAALRKTLGGVQIMEAWQWEASIPVSLRDHFYEHLADLWESNKRLGAPEVLKRALSPEEQTYAPEGGLLFLRRVPRNSLPNLLSHVTTAGQLRRLLKRRRPFLYDETLIDWIKRTSRAAIGQDLKGGSLKSFNTMLWVTAKDDIDGDVGSDNLVDMLGLDPYYYRGQTLVELRIPRTSVQLAAIPTVFDAGWHRYFRPAGGGASYGVSQPHRTDGRTPAAVREWIISPPRVDGVVAIHRGEPTRLKAPIRPPAGHDSSARVASAVYALAHGKWHRRWAASPRSLSSAESLFRYLCLKHPRTRLQEGLTRALGRLTREAAAAGKRGDMTTFAERRSALSSLVTSLRDVVIDRTQRRVGNLKAIESALQEGFLSRRVAEDLAELQQEAALVWMEVKGALWESGVGHRGAGRPIEEIAAILDGWSFDTRLVSLVPVVWFKPNLLAARMTEAGLEEEEVGLLVTQLLRVAGYYQPERVRPRPDQVAAQYRLAILRLLRSTAYERTMYSYLQDAGADTDAWEELAQGAGAGDEGVEGEWGEGFPELDSAHPKHVEAAKASGLIEGPGD